VELYEWELSFGPVSGAHPEPPVRSDVHEFTSDELERLTICRDRLAAGFYRDDT
jgi:hypothetical protein